MSEATSDSQAQVHAPRPTTVRYNDWRQVEVPSADAFEPTLGVSVIVPYFEAPEKLALTLAGLEGQTYPRELFEIVVVDDGSEPPLQQPTSPLNVKVLHQEKRGFGLARARNNGARAGDHDILVFLDGDMIAETGWLAAHARWHHVVSDALTLGFYARVSPDDVDASTVRNRAGTLKELFADREFDPPWTERHMLRTDDFTSKHDDLFRAVSGGNLGIGKAFFESLGGFDESFDRYGSEDTEFGYRGQTCGGLLIPVRDAFAWHQGRWIDAREGKRRSNAIQSAKLSNLIAHPDFRPPSPGQIHAVPHYVVTIHADQTAAQVLELAEDILADPIHDLVIRIELAAAMDEDERSRLLDHLGADPRVRVDPTDCALKEFPATPFQVDIPGCIAYWTGLIADLRAALGTAVQSRYELGDGHTVSITRTWARHRARRAGKPVGSFGDTMVREQLPPRPDARRGDSPHNAVRTNQGHTTGTAGRILAEARLVHDIASARRFLKWLCQGLIWWIARGRKVRRGTQGDPDE